MAFSDVLPLRSTCESITISDVSTSSTPSTPSRIDQAPTLSFFSLPAELRNDVYSHYFLETRSILFLRESSTRATLRIDRPQCYVYMANKQLRHETSSWLLSNKPFAIELSNLHWFMCHIEASFLDSIKQIQLFCAVDIIAKDNLDEEILSGKIASSLELLAHARLGGFPPFDLRLQLRGSILLYCVERAPKIIAIQRLRGLIRLLAVVNRWIPFAKVSFEFGRFPVSSCSAAKLEEMLTCAREKLVPWRHSRSVGPLIPHNKLSTL